MYRETKGRSAPLELRAVGTFLQRMDAHPTSTISKMVQGLVNFPKVLHHMVVTMEVGNLTAAKERDPGFCPMRYDLAFGHSLLYNEKGKRPLENCKSI